MGRTLPSITTIYYSELAALSDFKHALERSDQLIFDVLFVFAHKHLAEAAYATHTIPVEMLMLAMLLEEHKVVVQVHQRLADTFQKEGWSVPNMITFFIKTKLKSMWFFI